MSLAIDSMVIQPPGGDPLFAPLTLDIGAGTITTLMGPSGVGKTTLLHAIAGHLAESFTLQGTLRLNGRLLNGLPAERRRIGLMFQDATLFPHLSVGDNLAFGLRSGVKGRQARAKAVDRALASAGLDGMRRRDPATLSGGQRARAALMQSLLAEPEAILLDEPFSRLDETLRADIRAFVLNHIRDRSIPALLVTHDPADARAAGGPTIPLGEGAIA
ncbi:ATP-binding cassette domain-containing protein [Spiribacter vilamensis]|uniref:Putative thiamine transport system ATP-binding protein n=1 Tax=Spiribacter vilamensis TaxID=531306 RepID=A0A4Q8CZB2_9GAMM|nr:ATP-binding cassette domain-containing protein [Spiribacter vilamensis]RZU98302.1 putative thiamine transport system ATP-binding protein [Spiribacter vilamensis]TVO60807.1 ATP-binding cassette domain-containing protein [Spiribacter vilamensis]